MSQKIARAYDFVNMRCPHGGFGVIITYSDDVLYDGLGVARKTDKVMCGKCGCIGQIITGSETYYADGLQVARVDDETQGTCNPGKKCCPHGRNGIIIKGSNSSYTA